MRATPRCGCQKGVGGAWNRYGPATDDCRMRRTGRLGSTCLSLRPPTVTAVRSRSGNVRSGTAIGYVAADSRSSGSGSHNRCRAQGRSSTATLGYGEGYSLRVSRTVAPLRRGYDRVVTLVSTSGNSGIGPVTAGGRSTTASSRTSRR